MAIHSRAPKGSGQGPLTPGPRWLPRDFDGPPVSGRRALSAEPLALTQEAERRSGRRYPCPVHVAVGAQRVVGCDISRGGISVYMPEPLPVGDVLVVSLGHQWHGAGAMSGRARVLRSEPNPLGFLVALQFVDQMASPDGR
jgi:hypothetical protein